MGGATIAALSLYFMQHHTFQVDLSFYGRTGCKRRVVRSFCSFNLPLISMQDTEPQGNSFFCVDVLTMTCLSFKIFLPVMVTALVTNISGHLRIISDSKINAKRNGTGEES